MRYYSTRNRGSAVSFAGAALAGLAPDGGLYVPEEIPQYSSAVRKSLAGMAYADIAFETIHPWTREDIPAPVLGEMIHEAYPFGAPLVRAGDRLVLELFHGPTAAFKDFGARFMARAFSFLRRGEDRALKILVATSGDTGGAVADGFFGVEGVTVTVLYPAGRVSPLQERQIAGLGGNIDAIAVEGSFDDCQRLVKEAFRDADLKKRLCLSSANSINISRLIPQAVYYSAAAARVRAGLFDPDGEATPRCHEGGSLPPGAHFVAPSPSLSGRQENSPEPARVLGPYSDTTWRSKNLPLSGIYQRPEHAPATPPTLAVPSGNFGNLTAGLYAWKMGAPVGRFIAATNINKTVPDFLESGNYEPRLSQATLSNAMDVGSPSNYERMAAHFSWEEMRHLILGAFVSDEETRETISEVFSRYAYYLDPHSAVGWRAADKLREAGFLPPESFASLAVLSTAHPAKFAETVEPLAGPVPVPPSLQKAMERPVKARTIPVQLEALKELL